MSRLFIRQANHALFLVTIIAMLAFFWAGELPVSAASSYYVSPSGNNSGSGSSSSPFKTVQKALDVAQPGDTINLAPGTYKEDLLHSVRDGRAGAPITITGPSTAVVKATSGGDRLFEIHHDYLTLDGFTIDGLTGASSSASGYSDKLIYVIGAQTGNGVTGLRILNMTIQNSGGECIRLRYLAVHNEIAHSTIRNCGVVDFRFSGGGKNGEGIYVGTAPEQRGDGKNPDSRVDESNDNWIHHNSFNTQGNECVDIKEGAANNIVEYNDCQGQKDPNSGGFDSRGSGNIFRYNKSHDNLGAGVRLGGDASSDGINNQVYYNELYNNQDAGIKAMRMPQGTICGNTLSNNAGGDTNESSLKPAQACPASVPPPSDSTTTPVPVSTTTIPTNTVAASTNTPRPSVTNTPRQGVTSTIRPTETVNTQTETVPTSSVVVGTGDTLYVSPTGSDSNSGRSPSEPFATIAHAIDLAQPGIVIVLESGIYNQNIKTVRDGQANKPIRIVGPQDAIVRGDGTLTITYESAADGHVVGDIISIINHDYIQLEGFTIDGGHGDLTKLEGYRMHGILVAGIQPGNGIVGFKFLRMQLMNIQKECLRLRYLVQGAEIANSNIHNCGKRDFSFLTGTAEKRGEGIYIGTAPEQLTNGINPDGRVDQSNNNWIHHNVFNTQGNECVDIKEGSTGNITEYNDCQGQKDIESGGFDSRGEHNIFRYNKSHDNLGSGFRLGGDAATDGISNDVYYNEIYNNARYALNVQRTPQGIICGNTLRNNSGGDSRITSIKPAETCASSVPKPMTATVTPLPTSTPIVVPTNTPVVATNTAVPATSTSIPATSTSLSATNTAVPATSTALPPTDIPTNTTVPTPTTTPTASIGDRVWEDVNGDGVQTIGELGIIGVSVELLDENNNVIATTSTNALGIYSFGSVVPGTYRVHFVLASIPAGYQVTTNDRGGNESLDSDADMTTGQTFLFELSSGQNANAWDMGIVHIAAPTPTNTTLPTDLPTATTDVPTSTPVVATDTPVVPTSTPMPPPEVTETVVDATATPELSPTVSDATATTEPIATETPTASDATVTALPVETETPTLELTPTEPVLTATAIPVETETPTLELSPTASDATSTPDINPTAPDATNTPEASPTQAEATSTPEPSPTVGEATNTPEPNPTDPDNTAPMPNMVGIADGDVLRGNVEIRAEYDADVTEQIRRVRFQVRGPRSINRSENSAPYVFTSRGNSWDTTNYPDGEYTMRIVTIMENGDRSVMEISFTIANESDPSAEPTTPPFDGGIYHLSEGDNWIEAEDTTNNDTGHWVRRNVSGASGGTAMYLDTTRKGRDNANDVLEYRFTMDYSGSIYFWYRGIASPRTADPIWIQLDDGPKFKGKLDRSSWIWKLDNDAAKWEIEPGVHTIRIYNRFEQGTIDKLLVTTNKSRKPSGQGGTPLSPGN